jgi:hypothetical protein
VNEPAGMAALAFLAGHGPRVLRVLVAALIARRLWYHVASIPGLPPEPVFMRLWVRLALAVLGLWLFHRSVRGQFGASAADLSLAVLLLYPELAVFENKPLPVSVAAACIAVALWGMCRLLSEEGDQVTAIGEGASHRVPVLRLLLAGLCTGLSLLAVPYLLAGLPLCFGSLWILARSRRGAAAPWIFVFSLGLVLAFGIEALREFVIGPPAQWLSLAGMMETLRAVPSLDGWGPERLWRAIGNDLWRRDPIVRAEMEQTFVIHHIGLPFGALLGLGYLGCAALVRRAVRMRGERARRLALALALAGQIVALLLWATLSGSLATRVLLGVPLAFMAGPALLALFSWRASGRAAAWQLGWVSLLVALLLFVQAYWPRA